LRIDSELDEKLEKTAETVLLPLTPDRSVSGLERSVQENAEEMFQPAGMDEPVHPRLV
jgi:hypothetical protein